MSTISQMVLFTLGWDDEAVARLNEWCAANDERGQQFQELNADAAGGTKVFTSKVWAMAGNYFRHEMLAEVLPSFGWRYPHHTVLIVNYEHDECSRVYRAAPEREPSMW